MSKQILISPMITEKTETLSESLGRYTFIVNRGANKIEIRNAVESTYSVSVDSVNVVNVLGKSKVRNTKSGLQRGRKPSYKKAIVKLSEGEEIDFFGDI